MYGYILTNLESRAMNDLHVNHQLFATIGDNESTNRATTSLEGILQT